MPDIRYVCLSDMHFGAETSLLTNLSANGKIDPLHAAPVLKLLVACLREVIEANANAAPKPTLVLNGDILELALAQDNDAAMTFQRFIELAMLDGNPLFERIVYKPGNHDHHLWETARETQFAEYVKDLPWDQPIERAWHTSRIFGHLEESYFLNSLLKRHPKLEQLKLETAYPNFGLVSADLKKAVVFHHGHLTEGLYLLMSELKTILFPGSKVPKVVWDIECENFAWIDFFWSALGRSGDAGVGVGRIYEKLQDDEQLKKLLRNLAKGLADRFGNTGWLANEVESKLLEFVFDAIAGAKAIERHNTKEELSERSETDLAEYVNWPLKTHILAELGFTPPDFTLVFGHTHKPFEGPRSYERYDKPVLVYNSGGWVVDHVEREERFGGAVILLDENLHAVSLRMYNERKTGAPYSVKVAEARRTGEAPSKLFKRLKTLVAPGAEPWKTFSTTVASEIETRADYLEKRIAAQSLTPAQPAGAHP